RGDRCVAQLRARFALPPAPSYSPGVVERTIPSDGQKTKQLPFRHRPTLANATGFLVGFRHRLERIADDPLRVHAPIAKGDCCPLMSVSGPCRHAYAIRTVLLSCKPDFKSVTLEIT